MAKSHRFPNYTITGERGPKKEPYRTPAEKKALRERSERLRQIDDMEFAKKLGIFNELY